MLIQVVLTLISLEIDACTMKGHTCDGNALCISNGGMYKCICKDGFQGDGNNCLGTYRKIYVVITIVVH